MKDVVVGLMLVVFLVVVGALYALVTFLLEIGRRVLEAIDSMSWLIGLVVLVVAGAALYVVINGAIAASRAMHLRSRQVHPRNGLWPMMHHGGQQYVDMNAINAQHLAIMAQAQRRTAAQVRAVMQPQPFPQLPAPDVQVLPPPPPQPLQVQKVIDVDARTDPHWLLVGSTGSGKTAATYSILNQLSRRIPVQAVICEPGGINWKNRATAIDTIEIARTIDSVKAELERRQEVLRQSPYDHISDLPDAPPYVVLVAEEIETLLDDLKLRSRELRVNTIIALREIARTGRKCGVLLMAITQSGSLDVFDGHVRKNMTNTLLFRSEHTVPEAWRLQNVKLSEIAPGWAYSVKHSGMVYFPLTSRPDLAALELPRSAQPPQLVAPIAVPNWPQPGNAVPVDVVATGCEPVLPVLPRLQRDEQPDAATAATIRRLHAADPVRWSKNKLIDALWGSKDGRTFAMLNAVLDDTSTQED